MSKRNVPKLNRDNPPANRPALVVGLYGNYTVRAITESKFKTAPSAVVLISHQFINEKKKINTDTPTMHCLLPFVDIRTVQK